MLEKNAENNENSLKRAGFCDAHFHYAVCKEHESELNVSWTACSCAHSFDEWELQKTAPSNVIKAFGLHPQLCSAPAFNLNKYTDFLEGLLDERNTALKKREDPLLKAIGEAGFDYFTSAFKEKRDLQEEMWNIQLELAEEYKMPLVIHCRKANEKLFEYAPRLKKLPAVLFHSFMGSLVEAKSLIGWDIKCFFSFGKQMLNGNKKVNECVKELPIENLLLETDAPFQTLKGEAFTRACEIERVYEAAAKIRGMSLDQLIPLMKRNFNSLFGN